MKDADQAAVPSLNGGNDLPERLWAYDDFAAIENRPADFATGMVSLGFLKAAIRRSRRFWCITAIVGFLVGCGLYAATPPMYQASTSVVLTYGPYENAQFAAPDEQVMAQSTTVAGIAVHDLGIPESASSFLSSYAVTVLSERVLLITFTAPSTSKAIVGANAVAKAFLQFRARQLDNGLRLITASLDQQMSQARQRLSSINKQISVVSAELPSPTRQTKLNRLLAQRRQENTNLASLQQAASGTGVSTSTALAVRGSKVLDPATPLHHSRFKPLIARAVIGLIGGLVLGIGIVVVRALLSDRLRRREDVAYALSSPVKLSVGAVRLSRWIPGRRRLEAARSPEVRRIVAHLAGQVRPSPQGLATLGVVPVDDPQVAALSLVSLALSCAHEGKHVIVADLCSGAPAARLLGARKPGVRGVRIQDAHLVAAVPDDDMVPVGPLELAAPQARQSSFTGEVLDACASADLLLTLAPLDPSLGSEYLATWATDIVAFVTAGKSSATRLHAVAEMIRLAGVPLASVILVGADKTDESVGVAYTSRADSHATSRRR